MSFTLFMETDNPKKTRKALFASSILLIIICKLEFLPGYTEILTLKFAVKQEQLATAGSLVVYYFIVVFCLRLGLLAYDKRNEIRKENEHNKSTRDIARNNAKAGRNDMDDRDGMEVVFDDEMDPNWTPMISDGMVKFIHDTVDQSYENRKQRALRVISILIDVLVPLLLGLIALRFAKNLVNYSDFFSII